MIWVYLRDIAGLGVDHHNKANIPIKKKKYKKKKKKLMEILDLGSWDSGCLISKDGKG